jgi:hypothetical protein
MVTLSVKPTEHLSRHERTPSCQMDLPVGWPGPGPVVVLVSRLTTGVLPQRPDQLVGTEQGHLLRRPSTRRTEEPLPDRQRQDGMSHPQDLAHPPPVASQPDLNHVVAVASGDGILPDQRSAGAIRMPLILIHGTNRGRRNHGRSRSPSRDIRTRGRTGPSRFMSSTTPSWLLAATRGIDRKRGPSTGGALGAGAGRFATARRGPVSAHRDQCVLGSERE